MSKELVRQCVAKYEVAQSRALECIADGDMWRADCYLRSGARLALYASKIDLDLTLELLRMR